MPYESLRLILELNASYTVNGKNGNNRLYMLLPLTITVPNPQESTSKTNPPTYKKDYTRWPSVIYPKNVRLVKHRTVNIPLNKIKIKGHSVNPTDKKYLIKSNILS